MLLLHPERVERLPRQLLNEINADMGRVCHLPTR
jgi:hypothetical protein